MWQAHLDLPPSLLRAGDLLETGDLLRLTLRLRTGDGLLLRLSFRPSAGELLLAGEALRLFLPASLSPLTFPAWPLAKAGFEAAERSAEAAAMSSPCPCPAGLCAAGVLSWTASAAPFG